MEKKNIKATARYAAAYVFAGLTLVMMVKMMIDVDKIFVGYVTSAAAADTFLATVGRYVATSPKLAVDMLIAITAGALKAFACYAVSMFLIWPEVSAKKAPKAMRAGNAGDPAAFRGYCCDEAPVTGRKEADNDSL